MGRFTNGDDVVTRNGYNGVYLGLDPELNIRVRHWILLCGPDGFRSSATLINDENLFTPEEYAGREFARFSDKELVNELVNRGHSITYTIKNTYFEGDSLVIDAQAVGDYE